MDTYGDRPITFRMPYTMNAEVIVKSGEKGVDVERSAFCHRMDKPFEVRRFVLRLTALDQDGRVLDPQPTVLDRLITTSVHDYAKNERLTQDAPFQRLPGGELHWELEHPSVIERSQGLDVSFNGRSFELANDVKFSAMRIQVTLEGKTLVLGSTVETV